MTAAGIAAAVAVPGVVLAVSIWPSEAATTQYREGVAWQNTAYNQPPHPSFFLGDGMGTPAAPGIYTP
ncbi:hypothetical protein ACQP1P_18400 [Dactylosporangium sp. CA-052675]|uniref:rhamnogalacturonan lyase family protein n=1 Tax=Dactylosporangium sp. CA-052675 TaxID=3239927 RepID=UPI003D8A4D28